MRFISRGRHYGFGGGKLVAHDAVIDGKPTQIIERWDAEAKFGPTGHMPPPTDAEVKFALERLGFNGVGTPHPDSLEHLVPVNKIGVFDSQVAQDVHGWNDEQRKQIEQSLINGPDHGVEYVVFEAPVAARPWPRYDDILPVGRRTIAMVAEKIAELTQEFGKAPGEVIAYERENLNRAEVIAALEAIEAPVVEAEITVTA